MTRMTTKTKLVAFVALLAVNPLAGCESSGEPAHAARAASERVGSEASLFLSGTTLEAPSSVRVDEVEVDIRLERIVLGASEAAQFELVDPDSELGDLELRASTHAPLERVYPAREDSPATEGRACDNPDGAHPPTPHDPSEVARSARVRVPADEKAALALEEAVGERLAAPLEPQPEVRLAMIEAQESFLDDAEELTEFFSGEELRAERAALKALRLDPAALR